MDAWLHNWILTLVIFSPLVGALMLMLPRRGDLPAIRQGALVFSLLPAFLTVAALIGFYNAGSAANGGYVLTTHVPWIAEADLEGATVDISYRVGVDGISIWLLALTAFLMPLAVWSSFSAIRTRVREFYILLLLLEVGLLGVFCSLDLLLFYVFFEFTLVPLYFLIGIWGGPERRRAANKFFIYTLAGSVLTFAGVVYLAYFTYAISPDGILTLSIEKLAELAREGWLPPDVQWWLFLAFAAGFAIKVPLFPLHTWLPLAHTEAPTAGSVILAGVLLKLGTYGFCRLSIPILPDASWDLAPVVAVFAIIGIIYAALAAWVQTDIKKLVAYSSVSHLGFCMLGLFSLKLAGVSGAVIYMINHGLSTGALFLVVGFVYERYHTRDIHKIGGLARQMPWMAFFLIFFTLASIGLPGLNGFVGEFLVLLGTAVSATTRDALPHGPLGYGYVIPAALGIILGAVYMLWMCQRVLFGPLKEPPDTPDTSTGLTRDLTLREIGCLAPIALCCVIIGVYPQPLLESFEPAIVNNILLGQESSASANENPVGASARAAGFSPRGASVLQRAAGFSRRGRALEQTVGLNRHGLSTFSRSPRSGQSFVPEGHLKVAQRFIAGNPAPAHTLSPVGTTECRSGVSAVPTGLCVSTPPYPSDESLGYSHLPLRGTSGERSVGGPAHER